MAGNNQNGYAESRRLVLGVGDIYLNGIFVGNLKGKVELNIKRTYAYQRAGNNIADQKAEVTSEEVTMAAELCDLKLSQLRTVFGINQAVDTSTAKLIYKREVLKLTGTTGDALAETLAATTNYPAKVMSLDRKKTYVSGTDYLFSGSGIKRVSGGMITTGSYVIVEYPFSDSGSSSLDLGGETLAVPTFRLDYVIRDDQGKAWQITFFRALADTDFKMAFNEIHSGTYTTHNVGFKALVDITRPEGANMMEIVQEDATL